MAVSKKYAGLPDLDPAPEIYETPELTDDASTIQTNTLRTESPSPSENGQANDSFDRARLNQEEARRRFEPAIVDARQTNLSDAIGNNRKGNKTSHRRTRRRRREDGVEEYGDLSGESSEEEESLSKKLARLRRETEEVRLELARREKEAEDEEFKDSYEHHQNGENDDDKEVAEGVEELGQVLDSLNTSTRQPKGETLEQEFSRKLVTEGKRQNGQQNTRAKQTGEAPTSSNSISAIAAFADRLTALETALGVSSLPTTTETGSILPTLHSLSSQITVLFTTLSSQSSPSTLPHLDQISTRLQTLQQESETLLASRKAALQTLSSLHDARNRGSNNSNVFAKYLSKREARERQRESQTTTATAALDDETEQSRPQSKDKPPTSDANFIEQKIYTDVFLDEQSSKITALYNTLSTIQNLQPLLPLVLERLRGLNVIHAGAATAQEDMSDLEARLDKWEGEMNKWRDAVEEVEKGIEDGKVVMKENVDVIGEMVRDVEMRLDGLEKSSR